MIDGEKRQDSLKRRYFSKLFANLIGLSLNAVTLGIVPRGLGPKAYGDFSFLSNFFSQIVNFLDMGTSIGFYTKLSQRQDDAGLITFYLRFAAFVTLALFLVLFMVGLTPLTSRIWPDQGMFFVYLAAAWGIFSWFVNILNKMVDAFGLTVPAEVARIGQKFLGAIIILGLFFSDRLDLRNFFLYHYVLFLVLGFSFIWLLKRHTTSVRIPWKLPRDRILAYAREFYQYSHPLFVYALAGLLVGILERWLLQIFSGSIQQGFYGLSYQIGAVCFLFTGAMTPLITREFSVAYAQNDPARMARLFRQYIPLFYAIAAFFSCFIVIQAKTVAYIFGGSKFDGASLPLAIMAFYPVHQTYGQLSASVLLATAQTRLYRNIGVTLMLFELPVTYFLVAPPEKMGLDLGATGLALAMILAQFIGVNAQLYFNAKFLKLSFREFFVHQLSCAGCLLLVAFLSLKIVNATLASSDVLMVFLSNGILYTAIVAGLACLSPSLFGLTRQDLLSCLQLVKRHSSGEVR